LSFYEGVGVGLVKIEELEPESEVLKIEESESELLCIDCTALRRETAVLALVRLKSFS
jgi:hypothetical protein